MSSNNKWELIKNLDLSSVKEKLKSKKGFWWRWKNDVDKLEAEYRQFLYLAATHPEEIVVPWTQNLDDFWHEHILDTAKYEKDCQVIFGKMFHHNPHLPAGTPEQAKAYNKTKEMYKESFGEKAKASQSSSSDPGCSSMMFIPVFCGVGILTITQSHHILIRHMIAAHMTVVVTAAIAAEAVIAAAQVVVEVEAAVVEVAINEGSICSRKSPATF